MNFVVARADKSFSLWQEKEGMSTAFLGERKRAITSMKSEWWWEVIAKKQLRKFYYEGNTVGNAGDVFFYRNLDEDDLNLLLKGFEVHDPMYELQPHLFKRLSSLHILCDRF